MIAFEIYLNKVKVCTAGLDDFEFLHASLCCVVNLDGRPDERKIHFGVGGLDDDKKQYEWFRCELQKDNRVEFRIVSTSKIDQPKEVACSGDSCATEDKASGLIDPRRPTDLVRSTHRPQLSTACPRLMSALEVYVNKVKVCTPGLDEFEFVHASLSSLVNPDRRPDERKISFSVTGSKGKKLYKWVSYKLLKGNRVEIRIVDTSDTNEPKELTCRGGSCSI